MPRVPLPSGVVIEVLRDWPHTRFALYADDHYIGRIDAPDLAAACLAARPRVEAWILGLDREWRIACGVTEPEGRDSGRNETE